MSRTSIHTTLRDGPYITGVKSEPENVGLIDVDRLDSYIHDSSEWKIRFCEDGSYCCAPYVQYQFGVENVPLGLEGPRRSRHQEPIASKPTRFLRPSSKEVIRSSSEGRSKKRKGEEVSLALASKKSSRGVSPLEEN